MILGDGRRGEAGRKTGREASFSEYKWKKMKLDFGSIQESDLSILEKDFPDFQRDEEEKENFL